MTALRQRLIGRWVLLNLTGWLPFLNTYRTMCIAPEPDFKRVLEDIRELQLAA